GDPAGGRPRSRGRGRPWGPASGQPDLHSVTGANVSAVGAAGSTLGGGTGWLHRMFGLSCDNLLAAEIVTADADVASASAGENPDLFWALRGGGNFGAVTNLTFALHPIGPAHVGLVACPMD